MLKSGAELSANSCCSSSEGSPGVDVGETGDDKAEEQVTYLFGSLAEAYLQLDEGVVQLKTWYEWREEVGRSFNVCDVRWQRSAAHEVTM
jgi:hypothetical protein